MKKFYSIVASISCTYIFAQVGINTTTPKSTLEVVANTNGDTQAEGLIIPRLTGDQIKTMTDNLQAGTESLMIYATSAPAVSNAKVDKITKAGYYYWNGSIWETIGGLTSNIYTADGTITSAQAARNVELNGKNLVFSGVGSVGIGVANPSAKLDVAGTVKASAVDYNSDARLKQNITPITNADEIILKLNPVSYFWNENGKKKGGNAQLQYGLIAQEVEKVLPNIVNSDSETYKSVNYNELIPILLKNAQDQNIKIKELQKEIELLKKGK
ncbi:tail fiber domain-containing protein [Epilithonimonas ginsengisoli]|uniref:Tail fiber domain-containing protein n=1 Tax=Epilithonimonas ginsengisoli TaxID=1245592 RepID=A0ABU4JHL9_9FLAO|nr:MULTISPECIES: tail fiber domain-containing protein [Chryseobacterium group]MBV6880624.1 tail fiber domain-containing protein [Epilithonimonas sp. FP105]MDW8549169.1 tail fiber domain-containing protein [Epilithonimonas ginsengisoli]OAH70745.1 hypothetical protein AXA65_12700 [Chryseobacterium sp. FP211-J200]